MRIEQLEKALDRHGGDLRRWPAALSAEAEALIATNAKAAKLAATAARLEGVLAEAMRPVPVDAAFVGRIVAGLDRGTRTSSHSDLAVRPTSRIVVLACAAMVALLSVGYVAGVALPASQGEDAFAGLMFGNSLTADSDTGGVL